MNELIIAGIVIAIATLVNTVGTHDTTEGQNPVSTVYVPEPEPPELSYLSYLPAPLPEPWMGEGQRAWVDSVSNWFPGSEVTK